MIANPFASITMSANTTAQNPGGAPAVLQLTAATGALAILNNGGSEITTATGATTGLTLKRVGLWRVTFSCDVISTTAGAGLTISIYLANAAGTIYPGSLRYWDRASDGLTNTFYTEAIISCTIPGGTNVRPYLNGVADAAFRVSNATLTAHYLG